MADILNTGVRVTNLSRDYRDGTINLEIRLYEKEKVIKLGFDPDNITPIEIDFFGTSYTGRIHIRPGKPEKPLTFAWLSPKLHTSDTDRKTTKIPYLLSEHGIKANERIPARLTLTKLEIGPISLEEESLRRSTAKESILSQDISLPTKTDVEFAESQLRGSSDEVIGIRTVLDQVESNFKKSGKPLKENWRNITERNIEIWFSGKKMV